MGGAYQPCGHAHFLTNMIDYGMDVQGRARLPAPLLERRKRPAFGGNHDPQGDPRRPCRPRPRGDDGREPPMAAARRSAWTGTSSSAARTRARTAAPSGSDRAARKASISRDGDRKSIRRPRLAPARPPTSSERLIGPRRTGAPNGRAFFMRVLHRAGGLLTVTALVVGLVASTAASGYAAPATAHNAGVKRITLAGVRPLDVLVWYPTKDAETPFKAGAVHRSGHTGRGHRRWPVSGRAVFPWGRADRRQSP